MTFREVGVYEIREIVRLWMRGEGLRSIERLSDIDRKTVRRNLAHLGPRQRCVQHGAGIGADSRAVPDGQPAQMVRIAHGVPSTRSHPTDR
jgi:hypothetical protein